MHNLVIKNKKNLVALHLFHIITVLYWKFVDSRQKLNKKLSNIVNVIVKSTNIKIAFSKLFKVGDLLSVKESVPKYLQSFVVYRFTCHGCNANYIGETTRHLTTRIKEHSETDSKSHIFKHLNTNSNFGNCVTLNILRSQTPPLLID